MTKLVACLLLAATLGSLSLIPLWFGVAEYLAGWRKSVWTWFLLLTAALAFTKAAIWSIDLATEITAHPNYAKIVSNASPTSFLMAMSMAITLALWVFNVVSAGLIARRALKREKVV